MSKLTVIIGSGNAHKVREIRELLATMSQLEVVPFTDFEPVPDVEEDGKTFAANAQLKTRLFAQYLFARRGVNASGRHTSVSVEDTRTLDRISATRAREQQLANAAGASQFSSRQLATAGGPRVRPTDLFVIADDSGLVVDALGGAPGVHSARYAGAHGDDHANNAKLIRELAGVPAERRTARFVCAISLATQNGVLFTVEGKVEGRIAAHPEGASGFGYDPLFFYPPFNATFGQVAAERKNEVSHRAAALKAFRERMLRLLKDAGLA
jgi:non-canonical purine NTP pyrophosphatase (RdgB/HAM1 family)